MSAKLRTRVKTVECVPTNRERTSAPANLDIKEKTAKVVSTANIIPFFYFVLIKVLRDFF